MKNLLLVFFGGGLGSCVRFLIGRWVGNAYAQSFPIATLISNVAACFILGLAIGMADHKQWLSPSSRIFWTVGFCGGFSTFSTFSNETLTLFQQGAQATSIVYVFLSLLLCLLAVVAGSYTARL